MGNEERIQRNRETRTRRRVFEEQAEQINRFGREIEFEDELLKFFVQDLEYWTTTQRKKIIIFLDSFEVLLLQGRRTKIHPERDWWIKGDDKSKGLLQFSIPGVFWVLSGRDKFDYSEEFNIVSEEIRPFGVTESLRFLNNRGIVTNDDLCRKLTALTEGYPLYLELCAEHYHLLKEKNKNYEPNIDDFGKENKDFEEKVERIVFNLIECMDDTVIRETIKYLCALKTWRDNLAYEIIPHFNETAYNQVKKFSFIRNNDDIFLFDKKIQEILISKYKKENPYVINKTIENANSYYKKFVPEKFKWEKGESSYVSANSDAAIDENSLIFWAQTVTRLIDEADKLHRQYENNFEPWIKEFFDCRGGIREGKGLLDENEILQFDFCRDIIEIFYDRAKKITVSESIPCAYFELQLAQVAASQTLYAEFLKFAQESYEKFARLDATGKYIVDSLAYFATSLRMMGDFQRAVETAENAVKTSEKFFGKLSEKTIYAMSVQAACFEYAAEKSDNKKFLERAIEILENALRIAKYIYNPDDKHMSDLMFNLAYDLSDFQIARYLEAITLCEKTIAIDKKNNSDIHIVIYVTNHMTEILIDSEEYQKAKIVLQDLISYCEEKLGEYAWEIPRARKRLAIVLEQLGLTEEAESENHKIRDWYKQDFNLKTEFFGENSIEALDAYDKLLIYVGETFGSNFKKQQILKELLQDTQKRFSREDAEIILWAFKYNLYFETDYKESSEI